MLINILVICLFFVIKYFYKEQSNNIFIGINEVMTGGMYRFQGVDVDNYICFGTSDKNRCLDNIERYMYRIIGKTKEGQLKLLKKDAIHKLSTEMSWGDNENISWKESNIFKNINGEKYLNNSYYFEDEVWLNKIAYSNWKYGSISPLFVNYDREGEYAHDCDLIMEKEEEWVDSVNAKIGLLYLSDVCYSSSNSPSGIYYGSPIYFKTDIFSWMPLKYNDSYLEMFPQSSINNKYEEFLIDRYDDYFAIWTYACQQETTNNSCYFGVEEVNKKLFVRPVFYTISDIKIIGGTGKMEDPFLIKS